jgi:hypothetical protein
MDTAGTVDVELGEVRIVERATLNRVVEVDVVIAVGA